MPSHAIIVALEADIALYRSYRIDPCVPTRVLAGSLRCRLQDEKPAGTLWVTLTAACSHFLGTGTSLNDFKAQIGYVHRFRFTIFTSSSGQCGAPLLFAT